MKKMLTAGMISALFLMMGCQANEVSSVDENVNKEVEEIKIPTFETPTSENIDLDTIESIYNSNVITNMGEPSFYYEDNELIINYNNDFKSNKTMSVEEFYNNYIEGEDLILEKVNGFASIIDVLRNNCDYNGKIRFEIVYEFSTDEVIEIFYINEDTYKINKVIGGIHNSGKGFTYEPTYRSDIEDSNNTNPSNDDVEGWDESWSQHEYCTDENGNVDYCSDIETEEPTEEQSAIDNNSDWEQYGIRYWSEVVEFDRTSESIDNFDWEKEMNSIGESALGYEYIMFTYSDGCSIVTNEPDPNYFFVTLDEAEQWRN